MSAPHAEAKIAGPTVVAGAGAGAGADLAITPSDTLSSTDLSTPANEKDRDLALGSPSGSTSKEFDPSSDPIPRLDKDKAADAVADADADALSDENVIIRSGTDASKYLLSLRDDDDPILTVRSVVLGTAFACFQAAMNQIYNFKPTNANVSGAFILLILYFIGKAWQLVLPRGDKWAARYRSAHPEGRLPFYITLFKIINPHSFGLKEHAIATITATSASQGSLSIVTFTVQRLFYPDNPLSAATVVLAPLSIAMFGYGLTGLLQPVTVWAPESVFWSNVPLVTTMQSLHWESLSSKKLRYFWISFGGMFLYQSFPAYIFPWLNSVSIPCLASQNATGDKARLLTNLFGGSLANEGLGILNFSFDWQYITSTSTSQPIGYHTNALFGLVICWIAYLGVYYSNLWNARSLPFMASNLRTHSGGVYAANNVFNRGILDRAALASYGLPRLTGSYVWSLTVGNAAIGALITHVILFWRKDVWASIKALRTGTSEDRHHAAMLKKYRTVPWWWFLSILTFAFVLGIIVTTTQNITMPAWSYIIALLVGAFIAPFSTILYARYGSGIATNNLMKIVAGAVLPGRPLANLYFSSWSHSVISQSLNMASDLKMGEYLKIPPRTMFLMQIYGTIVGLYINYAVSSSIIASHRELLFDTHGNYAWSGAFFQTQNTQATSWALSRDMFSLDSDYYIVPIGLAIGVLAVIAHATFTRFVPRIGKFSLTSVNVPLILVFSGYLAVLSPQSCTMLSGILVPIFFQWYLRLYKPRIFREYSYLVAAAFDGGSLSIMFILSFAVFGAAGNGQGAPFPQWWGNIRRPSYPDHCPVP